MDDDDDGRDLDSAPTREVTAQPCDRPPTRDSHDELDAALPDLVLECECGEIEPAPVDAALGDTFACAYCGEFAVIKEP